MPLAQGNEMPVHEEMYGAHADLLSPETPMTEETELDIDHLLDELLFRQPKEVQEEALWKLAQAVEERERNRCLDLLAVAVRRIVAGKGRNWQTELNEAMEGIRWGKQMLLK